MAHIQRRKSGKWLARYRGPDGRERSKLFARKIDAERFLTVIESSKLNGTWVDPRHGRIRYREWHAKWWETTVNLRPSSRARDAAYARKHVLPRFGDYPLDRVRQLEVRQWVAALQSQGLAPATIHLIYQILSRSMNAAVDAGILATSPCRKIALPRIERQEMRFLEPAEVEHLANCMTPHYRTLIITAAYTGMRWGELAGLRPAKVNLLHRTIQVTDQLIEVKGELFRGSPKTNAGRRTLRLPPFLASLLETHMASPTVVAADLVFPTPEGAPLRRGNFRRREWLPAVRRARFDGLRFHDLRHTAVALAIAQGAHPKAIQQRMGHSSITVTLDRYGHLLPTLDDDIAQGLEKARRSALADSVRTEAGSTGERTPR